jgi:hypothetical protein
VSYLSTLIEVRALSEHQQRRAAVCRKVVPMARGNWDGLRWRVIEPVTYAKAKILKPDFGMEQRVREEMLESMRQWGVRKALR